MNQPSSSVTRRTFVAAASATTLAMSSASAMPVSGKSSDVVTIGVMGVSRGLSLAKTFAAIDGIRIKYLCDADSNRLKSAMTAMSKEVDYDITATGDFKDILNDDEVDVLVCAAPNHWHAPAGIMACAAGKHCYVEKPCSHNAWEGEQLVAAARKHKKCVQMGSQRRSSDKIQKAVQLVHDGQIGEVWYSRSWYANLRGPIGKGTEISVPDHIDYDQWQGPAPRQPFTSNRLPYHWHWVWDYGNGELGNNGVHSIDLSRWGLGVDYPVRVSSSGGRYCFDDDQQTPDTHLISFEFEGGKQIVWEGISCNRLGIDGESFGVTFHGDKGSIRLNSWGYELLDTRGKVLAAESGKASDAAHIQNFVDAIRADDPTLLNAEIEIGHKSTLLCHLGNIAHRTGDSLKCDPTNGHIQGNDKAMDLWKRGYEPGWEPSV